MDAALFQFDNSYTLLPERFYARLPPTPVAGPQLVRLNEPLARHLGLDVERLHSPEGIETLAGNRVPDGAEPLAMAYAGFQFGSWVPQLGDGRAILLGELLDRDGVRCDLQLKGAGRTPFSRMGDGRAVLGPVLREYIVSEAMAALGVPTTRSLAALLTGEQIMRESHLPGAVLVRVAKSHVRVGTFQFFAAQGDPGPLRQLAEYVIDRHYPSSRAAHNSIEALLRAVVRQQARSVASWQLVGFIHGVMNTDNMLLSGETVDYGPCAFMDAYRPDAVFSSIDHGGRYAYENQPGIAQWNLACLAQALVPILDVDRAQAVSLAQSAIDEFQAVFRDAYGQGMGAKLGLVETHDGDVALGSDLLTLLNHEQDDFTLAFRRLADLAAPVTTEEQVVEIFDFSSAYGPWLERWKNRCATDPRSTRERQQSMYAVNPAFIPRNHLVEEVIQASVTKNEFGPFHALVDVLACPFSYRSECVRYAMPPRPDQRVFQTFCGT